MQRRSFAKSRRIRLPIPQGCRNCWQEAMPRITRTSYEEIEVTLFTNLVMRVSMNKWEDAVKEPTSSWRMLPKSKTTTPRNIPQHRVLLFRGIKK